jgi:SAM-dependent methyltransferase
MSTPGVECNICGWRGASFLPLRSPGHSQEDQNVYCPVCGSYERHRALAEYLRRENVLDSLGDVLEVGSGLVTAYRRMVQQCGNRYVSLDLWPGFSDVQGDIVQSPFGSGAFDTVLCSHVLEHVADDFQALHEVRRIVKPSGLVVFQLPFDDERFETIECSEGPSAAIGSGYFYGHAREYGLDLIERLRYFWPAVLEVQPLTVIDSAAAARYGFDKNFGTFLFCETQPRTHPLPGQLYRDLLPLKRRWTIRRRAHEISLTRCGEGGALDDWLAAEKEVLASEQEFCGRNVYEILGRIGRARPLGE